MRRSNEKEIGGIPSKQSLTLSTVHFFSNWLLLPNRHWFSILSTGNPTMHSNEKCIFRSTFVMFENENLDFSTLKKCIFRNTFVMFAKEIFDYPELEEHPLLCNHLGNNIKKRKKKKMNLSIKERGKRVIKLKKKIKKSTQCLAIILHNFPPRPIWKTSHVCNFQYFRGKHQTLHKLSRWIFFPPK